MEAETKKIPKAKAYFWQGLHAENVKRAKIVFANVFLKALKGSSNPTPPQGQIYHLEQGKESLEFLALFNEPHFVTTASFDPEQEIDGLLQVKANGDTALDCAVS